MFLEYNLDTLKWEVNHKKCIIVLPRDVDINICSVYSMKEAEKGYLSCYCNKALCNEDWKAAQEGKPDGDEVSYPTGFVKCFANSTDLGVVGDQCSHCTLKEGERLLILCF